MMRRIRHRARQLAIIAVLGQTLAMSAAAAAVSCDSNSAHAGMADCPIHDAAPVCPLHADRHGSHDCDCATIGCSHPEAALIALFGAIGILPAPVNLPNPLSAADAPSSIVRAVTPVAPAPLAPPPRA